MLNTEKSPKIRKKIEIKKIRLCHVLSRPELDLRPKFHDPGTFVGVGKREQTHKQSRYNTEMSNFQYGRCRHLGF